MTAMHVGLLAGLVLGAAAAIGGFSAFLISLLVGVVGLVIGRIVDGDLAVGDLFGRGRDR
ncbi:hypothetical protein IQ251_01030 [Saccharopolyspora sp. HNM0983]|uniref:DUF2273 domain-containing protein n=1 Tax=Saccharopolyspora montiporae TaxID=2781240 RepID=A0A929B690_9PSEU|nr:hypothetical protein [Saccharopolyspora sp. HNM0983]MBE9373020.1 hypothetical protein [Saccharopolyspora sp. HNM0983]